MEMAGLESIKAGLVSGTCLVVCAGMRRSATGWRVRVLKACTRESRLVCLLFVGGPERL